MKDIKAMARTFGLFFVLACAGYGAILGLIWVAFLVFG